VTGRSLRTTLIAITIGSIAIATNRTARATPPQLRLCTPKAQTHVPSVSDYEGLEPQLNRAKADLDAAVEARDAAASRATAAAVQLAAQPDDAAIKAQSAAANLTFGNANIAWRNAVEALECAELHQAAVWRTHRLDQLPPSSVGFGLSIAGGAGGVNRAGGSVRYLSRPSVPYEYELSMGLDSVRPLDAPERYVALSPRFRLSFGTTAAAFFLGVSPTFVLRETLRIAAVGQIGAAVRNVLGRADARLFAEPWVPLDGAPMTILFGVELGAVFGLEARNKTAGKTEPWVDWAPQP
jgi:hypothetical protein